MKVEFIESEFWGAALLVAEADFKLAKTKDAEFDSLAHATAAFANLFDVDYTIARSEYNAALDALEKNGAVIFSIGSSQYPERRWVEIQVSNDNQPQRVLYADEDGYHSLDVPIPSEGGLPHHARRGAPQTAAHLRTRRL